MIATSALASRVLPVGSRPSRRSTRVVERNIAVARQIWLVIVSGFFEPLFYLLSIGIGIGKLVGHVVGPGRTVLHVAYLSAWVVAGVLAGTVTFRRRLVR